MDTYRIGLATIELGCGRKKKQDVIDPSAGVEFYAKVGDEVSIGDPVMRCFNSNQIKLESAAAMLKDCFVVGEKQLKQDLIL
jgi:thymidine phosphorylase